MVDINFIDVFDPKIVHNKGERNGARFMVPQTWCVDMLPVSKRG
jgi:hypothetical protein